LRSHSTPPVVSTTPPARQSIELSLSSSTRRSSPLRGSKRLHQLSKRWA